MKNFRLLTFVLGLILAFFCGCASTSSNLQNSELKGIGYYSLPPKNINKHTIAVLDFQDKTGGQRGAPGSDQMTTLLLKTRRFKVIERDRLQDILKEQNLEGIDPDEMAKRGYVAGVDLVCFGSITSFEIKNTSTDLRGGLLSSLIIGVANYFSPIYIPSIDFDYRKVQLDIHIGIDVRIVNTTTGEVLFADSADVKRTETASSLGLVFVGISTRPDGTVEIDNENQGKLLRMALDRVIKKMLPEIDKSI